MAPLLAVLASDDVAFGVVFAVFILALFVLAFIAIRWGVRHDRPGRAAWSQRMQERIDAAAKNEGPPPQSGQRLPQEEQRPGQTGRHPPPKGRGTNR